FQIIVKFFVWRNNILENFNHKILIFFVGSLFFGKVIVIPLQLAKFVKNDVYIFSVQIPVIEFFLRYYFRKSCVVGNYLNEFIVDKSSARIFFRSRGKMLFL